MTPTEIVVVAAIEIGDKVHVTIRLKEKESTSIAGVVGLSALTVMM